MKKLIALFAALALMAGFACAEDLQVQIIGGEDVPQATLAMCIRDRGSIPAAASTP